MKPLLTTLEDEDRGGRMCAAEALGDIGDAQAVESLIVALKYDGNVGMRAAMALGNIGDYRVVEPLINTTLHWDY